MVTGLGWTSLGLVFMHSDVRWVVGLFESKGGTIVGRYEDCYGCVRHSMIGDSVSLWMNV